MKDVYQAYMDNRLTIEPTNPGPLDGLTFSVKDVFAIKGYRNAAGNPDYLRTHGPSEENAPVIDSLLENGAKLIGTTHTDELMYSLNGENIHYGTPTNPKAPGHIPGGSSSGSAVAVAGGMVDFALGTDTGGSVRIPSSYCGIFGIRPTHGAVDITGVIPLADSFDTVGWMARDISTLKGVGEVLLKEQQDQREEPFKRCLFLKDAWDQLLHKSTESSLSAFLPSIKEACEMYEEITVSDEGLGEWANTFRIIQAMEIWEEHKDWIEAENPQFGPGIKERFEWASTLRRESYKDLLLQREKITNHLTRFLGVDGIFVIPAAPGCAPVKNLRGEELEEYRSRAMRLTCIAGLAGLPQVTLPLGEHEGLPVGLSIIGNHHQDLRLLNFAANLLEK
ncbi:amidase [Litchfieldia salsa]|uniref:Amidase n=1 Tax=Litchfieldia salsa TaxID=930152 RepID=A0A1H0UA00_9BACI|nr:amidase [Litchfieldia salsa]SDP62815.1 amidase [Litchfieldia salsa]